MLRVTAKDDTKDDTKSEQVVTEKCICLIGILLREIRSGPAVYLV